MRDFLPTLSSLCNKSNTVGSTCHLYANVVQPPSHQPMRCMTVCPTNNSFIILPLHPVWWSLYIHNGHSIHHQEINYMCSWQTVIQRNIGGYIVAVPHFAELGDCLPILVNFRPTTTWGYWSTPYLRKWSEHLMDLPSPHLHANNIRSEYLQPCSPSPYYFCQCRFRPDWSTHLLCREEHHSTCNIESQFRLHILLIISADNSHATWSWSNRVLTYLMLSQCHHMPNPGRYKGT